MKDTFEKIKTGFVKMVPVRSLQARLAGIIILFMVIPITGLYYYNFYSFRKILVEQTSSLLQENLRRAAEEINTNAEEINRISTLCGMDSTIHSSLLTGFKTSKRQVAPLNLTTLNSGQVIRTNQVESSLSKIKSTFSGSNIDIILIGVDGLIYTSLSNVLDQYAFKKQFNQKYMNTDWFRHINGYLWKSMWIGPFDTHAEPMNEKQPSIALVRSLQDANTQAHLGILIVAYYQSNYTFLSGNSSDDMVLLNDEDKVIFNSTPHAMDMLVPEIVTLENLTTSSIYYNKKEYLLNCLPIEEQGYKVLSLTPMDDVMDEVHLLRNKVMSINFLVLIVFTLICIRVIAHLISPLKKMIMQLKEMKVGEYRVDPSAVNKMERLDDVNEIVTTFYYLVNRVEELVDRVLIEGEKRHEMEYEILRAQINPHFLFNTLNSIKWCASISGVPNVAKMITSLGMLLEVSMNKGDDEISLEEEIELVKAYISIHKFRYDNEISLSIDIPAALLQFCVPKFILQPIVENSFIHGFIDGGNAPEITICASTENQIMTIIVNDNGIGVNPAIINSIFEKASNIHGGKLSKIGLNNVNERLKIKYGAEYGLIINPGRNCGTRTCIRLPCIRRKVKELC